MNQYLKTIQDLLQQNNQLMEQEKQALLKTLANADKQWSIVDFKLDRTEKVKRTTAILLEETIAELEKKRKDVEAQNRELEIESSLEKVRTVAMGMRKRDDMLDICRIISVQLELLGIKEIRNVQTAIFYEHKGTYINYEYYRLYDKALVTEVDYTNDEISIEFAAQMIKGADEVFIRSLEGQQVKDWLNVQRTTNVFIDTNLENARSLTYYWFSLGPVAIGMSTYDPLREEEITLFKRFRNVFDLAYRRYLDIEKAEAQAREARIEAALEKVRSRSLAMHRSDELQEVVHTVFEKLKELNVDFYTVIIVIFQENSKDIIWWMENKVNQQYPKVLVSYDDNPYLRDLFEAKENGKELLSKCYFDEEKNALYYHLLQHTDLKHADEKQKKFLLENQFATMSVAIAKNTGIHITSYSKKSFSSEENETLIRFAKVFEQAYIRFMDLQKAEAQARESQIQLALERVRARTMAMQKSDELNELIKILFSELRHLEISLDRCLIMTYDPQTLDSTWWMASRDDISYKTGLLVPYHTNSPQLAYIKGWQERKEKWTYLLEGDEKKEWDEFLFGYTALAKLPDEVIAGMKNLEKNFSSASFKSFGCLTTGSFEPLTDEAFDILIRFTQVFDQAYTRFLDLQTAEAQARESQIQLALERVRARTMAMQKSDELTDVAELLFKQVNDLGIKTWTTGFNVWSDDNNFYTDYVTNPQGGFMAPYTIDAAKLPGANKASNAKKRGDEFLVNYEEGEALAETYRQLTRFGEKQFKSILESGFEFPSHQYEHFVFGSKVSLLFITYDAVPETHDIFKRFGKVFEQTYTRFLDLQTAEAQAKESQIQLALERVRARTMAMQHSDELKDAAALLFQQVKSLGVPAYSCGYNIWEKDEKEFTSWMSTQDGSIINGVPNIPLTEDANFIRYVESKKNDEPFFVLELRGARMQEHYEYLKTIPAFKGYFDYAVSVGFDLPETQIHYLANFSQGNLLFITLEPCPEFHDVFKRFAAVFEQTYTRFLDLQKAEAQAREARIEAALERTRTQSMLMQHSKELDDTLRVFHEQALLLGIHSAFSFLWLPDEEKDRHIFWAAWAENNLKDFKSKAINYPLDRNDPATAQCLVDWKSDQPVVSYHVPPGGVESYFAAWQELIAGVEELKPGNFSDGLYYVEAFMKYGCFGVMIKSDLSEDEKKILYRFTIEFERTYTRFLDLQKAEAQAREAQIEAALERVRSAAMAMHKSEELKEVANEMRKQLGLLGQNELETCAIHLYDESPDYFQSWAALLSPNEQGKVVQIQSQFPKRGVKIIEEMLECYARHKQDYVLINDGTKAQEFLEMIKQKAPEAFEVVEKSMKEQAPEDKRAYWSVADFAGGSLVMTTRIEPGENSRALLRRFANVFGLAYRRFVDLKKAEAQAKEAQIETALERVRSRTLAMQKSDELAETAAVLFKQLILLGIEPNRLYINIIKDETGEAEFWITDEDGSKISMAYTSNMNANPSFKKMYDGWKMQNRSLVIDMKGKQLEEYFKHLSSLNVPFKGGLSQKRRLQYIAYFNKGFIGMASPDEQPEETMQLLERFAAVFNLTFTRFNDLKIAEAHALQAEQDLVEIKAAKKKAEDTLTELQATQKQLVQSEKMASLGELTAGIAHEIQNPLNFVNNFSDVSNELLEEMKTELEKGNTKEVISIVRDVKQNLEKILHHGKRADAIVKGMLQHSRTSSSQKELTDINALADEYLRLAYHGLRAKDKSFNASMKTDFDETVGKINIVPQEIGRVILNLINNAFYAVSERQKVEGARYEPTVAISTSSIQPPLGGRSVQIKVADNGGGVPQKVLEKIFQPFFTTKPTGQGTGLGLSLTYDIVKAHGGEINVETQEGEGSKFIVIIPSTQ